MKSLRRSLNSNSAGGSTGDRQRSASSQVHGSMRGGANGATSPPFSAPATGGGRSVSDTHPYGHGRSPLPPSMSSNGGTVTAVAAVGGQLHQPPQRVIKALRSFRSEGKPQMLSYGVGDFFYVTGERGPGNGGPGEEDGWWEALNTITGSRGIVSKSDFEVLEKGGRPQSGSTAKAQQPQPQLQSRAMEADREPRSASPAETSRTSQPYGAATGAGMGAAATAASSSSSGVVSSSTSQKSGASGASGAKKPQPLYAIVQYDFVAERADELDAKAGEPIIVIAQSNHEWFVAKPISRLGGPGLIPVSFVEIRDPQTSKPIENVEGLLAQGSLPPVDSWKKATAEYKKASIPLGQLETTTPVADSRFVQRQQQQQATSSHSRQPSQPFPSGSSSAGVISPPQGATRLPEDQIAANDTILSPAATTEHVLEDGDVISTHVKSFHYEAGQFWFRINVVFVPDDPNLDATSLVLYRLYDDFYNFQIKLLNLFPREAGRGDPRDSSGSQQAAPSERVLPYMPGPMEDVDVDITNARREDLDIYLRELLDLRASHDYILRHEHVLAFFSPQGGDATTAISRAEASSIAAQVRAAQRTAANGSIRSRGSATQQLDQRMQSLRMSGGGRSEAYESWSSSTPAHSAASTGHGQANPVTATSGVRNESPYGTTEEPTGRNPRSSASSGTNGRVGPSSSIVSPPLQTSSSTGSSSWAHHNGSARPAANGDPPPFIKIKVLDRTTEDMIAIRVPPRVTFEQLMTKVRDRLGGNVQQVQYRLPSGDGFAELLDDATLQDWLKNETKLVLYAE